MNSALRTSRQVSAFRRCEFIRTRRYVRRGGRMNSALRTSRQVSAFRRYEFIRTRTANTKGRGACSVSAVALRRMTYDDLRRGRHSAPNQTYYVTIVTAGRLRHFADFDIARAAIIEMRRPSDHRILDSFAWVLMPDHLHWLFQLLESQDFATAVKTFKTRSA